MTRPLRLAGALTVALSLWLPWYGAGAAAAIAGLVLIHVLDQPGPNQIVTVKVGPWVALAGAAAIALSARSEAAPAPAAAPVGATADAWAPAATASVPPPGA